MKSFTDLEQSCKLAEILPLESADMHYNVVGDVIIGNYKSGISSARSVAKAYKKNPDKFAKSVTPCWSLTALLNELSKIKEYWFYHLIFDPTLNKYSVEVEADSWRYEGDLYDNAIDAVYETILKLHEQKSK